MSTADQRAWGDFWAQNRRSGGGAGGCLPARWQGIDTTQRAAWREFAERLPRGARVLDLATGDGRVMGWLRTARRDLKLVGTDLAPELPDPPQGTRVRTGVAMEALPFADAAFDAATSQFGFEYGEVAKVAAEIARVVKPGGLVGLMTHRGDGPILEHNLQRREAIRWALEREDLAGMARRSLLLRASGLSGAPPRLADAPQEGARLFGEGSAAWEIAESLRRILVLGARDRPAELAQLIGRVEEQAANELGRIASLEAACARADDAAAIDATFDSAGLATLETRDVVEPGSRRPFAHFRLLRRA